MPAVDFPFLYGITDASLMPGDLLTKKAEAVLAAGLKILQYRDKSNDEEKRKREALALQKLCRRYGATLIINDDVKLALAIGADGVHLGLEDDKIEQARSVLGSEAIIGATCHNQLELARDAIASGANYIAFGRFYTSQTKGSAQPAALDVLRKARKAFNVPIVGIGGITPTNVSKIWNAGAHCAAVCNALFDNHDPGAIFDNFAQGYRKFLSNRDQYE